jgi:hypothetical protein
MPFAELTSETTSLWDKVCVVRGDLANPVVISVRDNAGLIEMATLMTPLANMLDLMLDDCFKADPFLPLLGHLWLVLMFGSYLG